MLYTLALILTGWFAASFAAAGVWAILVPPDTTSIDDELEAHRATLL